MWVVKLDSNGLKMWDKRFGGTYQEWAWATVIVQNKDPVMPFRLFQLLARTAIRANLAEVVLIFGW